ncbi:PIN2/TERF1-interacting telomerase inhibitor 1 [Ostrinia furnacalis]|uniref:PIN2/TERF1-interacting telomerase inhibitor 1 n=1 Tax=Ostrinia furnacalis TaxID=93504 RepID=UPI001038B03E|nr:PIN2/TERF1-interacting telomerase inhibitor 1 [Ostrinia furnacalis]
MAMLAGPRRKQKVINLRAKNNAWSNDSSKFGQRMLEKMGWSSGKGLGAKENGIVEHVVARYKNDDRGLGYEDKNDQWTKHEDDFNALLANLSNADSNEEKLHSGVSLEVKSKKSKARVHYHKFTRGKDLTRYSEKDLANIFGKKSLKEEDKTNESVEAQEDVNTTEQVFTEKGSMVDYFKSKLANFKSKSKLLDYEAQPEDDYSDFAFKGFSTNPDETESNDTHQGFGFSFYNSSETKGDKENGVADQIENVEETTIKKKKKKRKNKDLGEEENIDPPCVENKFSGCDQTEDCETKTLSKKSKKKNKNTEEIAHHDLPEKPKKKKSKKKDSDGDCDKQNSPVSEIIPAITEQDDYVPKKKKKRKNKDLHS